MILTVFVTFLLFVLVIQAWRHDPEPARRPGEVSSPCSSEAIIDHQAPMIPFGYDPVWVDAHLHRVVKAMDAGGAADPAWDVTEGAACDEDE